MEEDLDAAIGDVLNRYRECPSVDLLQDLHVLLLPVTKQEIRKVLETLFLPRDLESDMLQDAFIKLSWIVLYFDEKRGKYRAFWRRSVRNFLLSSYYSSRHHVSNFEDVLDSRRDDFEIIELVQQLRMRYEDEVAKMAPKAQKICAALVKHRIFASPNDFLSQPALAERLSVTQGFLSLWETWLKKKIREDYPEIAEDFAKKSANRPKKQI